MNKRSKLIVCGIAVIAVLCMVRQIFTNGGTADRLYKKYCFPQTQQKAICLPSTSPANAAWSKERLLTKWNQICPYLE